MGLTFGAVSSAGSSGGSIGDSWEAIGGGSKTIAVWSGSSGGTHYSVGEGKRFIGYIQCNNGNVSINGTEIQQNFWMYQQYYYNKKLIRLNAGDVVSSTSGYVIVMGTESSA